MRSVRDVVPGPAWFEVAKTPEQMAGRLVVALAAGALGPQRVRALFAAPVVLDLRLRKSGSEEF